MPNVKVTMMRCLKYSSCILWNHLLKYSQLTDNTQFIYVQKFGPSLSMVCALSLQTNHVR